MIDRFTEQKIKDVARITDVVSEFLTLQKCGIELTCPCPFHNGEHLNHFKVSPRKNMYYCFVCGVGGDPIDFLKNYAHLSYPDALRWLGNKYGIEVDEEQRNERFQKVTKCKPVPLEQQPELPMLTLPLDIVKARMATKGNVFCDWVRSLNWEGEEAARVESVLRAYCVGHSRNGQTIFWQIDEEARVRTGKLMWYLPDGHRDKMKNTNWIHSSLARAGMRELYDPEKQRMTPCLFGQHLLFATDIAGHKCDGTTVHIVESEKTAIIMSIAVGMENGIWLATGGMQFLKREFITHLNDLSVNVVLHPDHDGANKWRKMMTDYGFRYGMDYQIDNQFVDAYWREEDGEKADAADIVLRMLNDRGRAERVARLDEFIRQHPVFGELVRRLDLELVTA